MNSIFFEASQYRKIALAHQLATKSRHISDARLLVLVCTLMVFRMSDVKAAG
jgi:hypothetical protein